MSDDARYVTAYCVAAAAGVVAGYGWSGDTLQSVSVTGGGLEVTTVYSDVEEFRKDALRPGSDRHIAKTSPEGWLVLVAGSGEPPALARRTVLVERPVL